MPTGSPNHVVKRIGFPQGRTLAVLIYGPHMARLADELLHELLRKMAKSVAGLELCKYQVFRHLALHATSRCMQQLRSNPPAMCILSSELFGSHFQAVFPSVLAVTP